MIIRILSLFSHSKFSICLKSYWVVIWYWDCSQECFALGLCIDTRVELGWNKLKLHVSKDLKSPQSSTWQRKTIQCFWNFHSWWYLLEWNEAKLPFQFCKQGRVRQLSLNRFHVTSRAKPDRQWWGSLVVIYGTHTTCVREWTPNFRIDHIAPKFNPPSNFVDLCSSFSTMVAASL